MVYAIVAVIVLILDQGLKYWVLANIPLQGSGQVIIPKVLSLTHVHNTGAAFNILSNMRWLLVGLVGVFSVAVIVLLALGVIQGKFGRWTAVLVLAGALGNGIDRLFYGYVVDMFRLDFFPKFPIFNVADIFLVVGGILFCVYIILQKEPEQEYEAVEEAPRKRRGRRDDELESFDQFIEEDEEEPIQKRRPHRESVEEPVAQPRSYQEEEKRPRKKRPEEEEHPQQRRRRPEDEGAQRRRPRTQEEHPRSRRQRPAEEGQNRRPRPEDAPERRQRKTPEQVSAAKSSSDAQLDSILNTEIDVDAPEFTLEDIIREFSDN